MNIAILRNMDNETLIKHALLDSVDNLVLELANRIILGVEVDRSNYQDKIEELEGENEALETYLESCKKKHELFIETLEELLL